MIQFLYLTTFLSSHSFTGTCCTMVFPPSIVSAKTLAASRPEDLFIVTGVTRWYDSDDHEAAADGRPCARLEGNKPDYKKYDGKW